MKNNDPNEEFEDEIKEKREKVKELLKEKEGDSTINDKTFETVIGKFKKSRKPNYDMIVKADKGFQENMFKLCKEMIEKEQFPEAFKETTLHQIFKGGKGKKEILSDNRFIHSKPWMPRMAEAMVVEEWMKAPLVEESTMYQIGGQPGHRPEELMFVVKSVIAKYRAERKPIIIQAWDIGKYFDKEMIEDGILTCYKRGINPKAARCWYKLNEGTKIKVRTGVGMSEATEVGAVVGQGTIGGALISQAVLDEGIKEQFTPGGEEEMNYGEVPMGPCMLQDDLIHCSSGLEGATPGLGRLERAREASRKINITMKKHALKLNEKKSICLFMGSKKQMMEMESESNENPIKCGEVEMKQKQTDKWLGQQLSAGGLADSVAATVEAREAKVKGAALEIVNIVNDWRAEAVGGMETALLLWEACCVPTLLHGAGTWTMITAATENKLNSLQNWFLRLVLEVGKGAPLAALAWETGVLNMKLRIWREKILMILHIRNLDENSLARKIYHEQVVKGWPGLAKETTEICKQLNIEDCNKTNLSMRDYKYILKQAIRNQDENILRTLAKDKTKCKKIMLDSYGKKDYLSKKKIKDVREWFRTRVGMLPFAGNFSNDRRFARTEWRCRCGEVREVEEHILEGSCPVYSDLATKYSPMDSDEELVAYMREVLERRDKVDQVEEEERNMSWQWDQSLLMFASPGIPGTSQSSHVSGVD